jgi:NTP pyrophosphatase (non-canonical NTP hydrolase)
MTYASYREIESDIVRWAEARKIIPNAKPYTQLLKAVSEMGELCDAEIKGSDLDVEDAVGDVMVCLIIYCALKDINVEQCMRLAYNTIKNRKGTLTPEGVFVKEQ